MARYGRAPVQETSFDVYPSQETVFSVRKSTGCESCLTRIPYATLMATIQCALGVVIFCATLHRGGNLAVLMFNDVFRMRLFWLEAVKMTFVIIGACMAAIGLMILSVGFLATGATRVKVYRAWRSRVGGRITCAIFITITYILQIVWLVIFGVLIISTFLFTIFWKLCSNDRVSTFQDCIDFRQFSFMFPRGTEPHYMEVCGERDIKLFCKDYVEKAEVMFVLATGASVLVILSLIDYLMCLSANYAHIRDHSKFQELRDLQMLNDCQTIGGSKDRF